MNIFRQMEKDLDQRDLEIISKKGKLNNLGDLENENKFKNMKTDLESKSLQINRLETRSNTKKRTGKENQRTCRDIKFKCKQFEYTTGSEPSSESLHFPRG